MGGCILVERRNNELVNHLSEGGMSDDQHYGDEKALKERMKCEPGNRFHRVK